MSLSQLTMRSRLFSCLLTNAGQQVKIRSNSFPLKSRNPSSPTSCWRFSSSSVPPSTPVGGDGVGPKQSLFARFKAMYRDYWYVLVPVHVVTSLGWIGGFYYFVKSGVDLAYYMKKVGISDSVVDKITGSGAGNLAIAYALYKIATPARYTVTLGGTTLAINSLRNMGYIKPAKEIYSSNKNKIQKKIQNRLEKKR